MHRQQTFETHPWTFTTVPARGSLEPRQRLVVEGAPVFFPRRRPESDPRAPANETDEEEGRIEATVTRPVLRRWTHDEHKSYPEFFKRVSRAFLLAHARLRREPSAPPPPPPPRRSPRLLEKRVRHVVPQTRNAESPPRQDVGPASAEDDANACENAGDEGRYSLDSSLESFRTNLGDLPPELAVYVMRLAAPRCPQYRAVEDVVRRAVRGGHDVEDAAEVDPALEGDLGGV
jgi:hypothetical protein